MLPRFLQRAHPVGRPANSSDNLLAGLSQCARCGGALTINRGAYVCFRRRTNGSCTNDTRIPIRDLNEAVLTAIEEHVLTPDTIEQAILLTERDDHAERQQALAHEADDIDARIARLVSAIEGGADAQALITKLRELEARRAKIVEERSALVPVPWLPDRVIEDRLTEWRRLLRQSPTPARAVLQRVLRSRIIFMPVPDSDDAYTFEAPTRLDKLFSGVTLPSASVWSEPAGPGTERLRPEDLQPPQIHDYADLLEKAHAKWYTSPAGFEPALPA